MADHAERHFTSVGVEIESRLIPLLLFSTFAVLYSIYPNNYPHHDELYHVLAGAAWADHGSLDIGDGIYQRTPLYTILIGELFKVFGVGLPVARMPTILASAVCVLVVYLMVRSVGGRLEALVAAVGFGLCPLFADIAKMTRFYAFHTLLFMLGAFAIYHACAVTTQLQRRAADFAIAGVCLLSALYFQLTTVVGAIGLGLWAGCVLALQLFGPGRRLLVTAGLASGALAIALLLASQTGVLADVLEAYRRTAPWAAERANYEGFYVDLLLSYYPALLALFPLAALYALPRQPALTSMSLVVFGVGLVLHTFAGMKAERYVTYLMPFFWIVLGLASGPLLRAAGRAVEAVEGGIVAMPLARFLPPRLTNSLVQAVAIGSLASFAVINFAVPETLHKLKNRIDDPLPQWSALSQVLRLGEGTVLLTPNALHALYFVGDFHAELGPADEAAISQAGRPLVTSAAILKRIVECNQAGALVADPWRWNNPGVVTAEIRSYAMRHLEAHPAAGSMNLEIYTWNHDVLPDQRECGDAALGVRPLRLQSGEG